MIHNHELHLTFEGLILYEATSIKYCCSRLLYLLHLTFEGLKHKSIIRTINFIYSKNLTIEGLILTVVVVTFFVVVVVLHLTFEGLIRSGFVCVLCNLARLHLTFEGLIHTLFPKEVTERTLLVCYTLPLRD